MRFVNDMLLSAPSILIGLFIYALVVQPVGHFSGYAGGLALAVILLPVVVRTSEEALQLVPIRCAKPAWRWACRAGRSPPPSSTAPPAPAS